MFFVSFHIMVIYVTLRCVIYRSDAAKLKNIKIN